MVAQQKKPRKDRSLVVMRDNKKVQVVIAGAGPAGIAAALTLQARNITFVVVDAQPTGTHKPGDCIPPNAFPLFTQLGLMTLLDHQAHTFYWGNKSCWGTNEVSEKLFLFNKYSKGLLLNRTVFEQQLRELLLKQEEQVLFGYAIKKVFTQEGATIISAQSKNKNITLTCDYVIDATGRKATISKKFKAKKDTLDQLAALDFYYPINKPIHTFVNTESFSQGWLYAAPASTGELSILLFSDLDLLPAKNQQPRHIKEVINHSTLISQLIGEPFDERKIKRLTTRAANSTHMHKPYGSNWVAIGDAAYSFDPVSSFGITSALASGYYGAHALADTLQGKKEALPAYHYIMEEAFAHYQKQLHQFYTTEKRWTQAIFWSRRG